MTRRSLRWDSPTTAAVAGGLTLVLLVVDLVLSFAEHNFTSSVDGALYAIMMAFAAVGLVVARQQPRNPIGWLLLGVALFEGIYCFAALYVAIDYGSHHGSLPFGLAAIWGQNSFWDLGIIIGLPALLLFPDGRLTSSRWVWALRAYAAIGVIVLASQCFTSSLLVSWVSSHQTHITGEGQFIGHPRVDAIVNFLASGLLVLALVPFWLSWVVLQMRAFRRSSGELRQQLKWFSAGAAVMVIGLVLNIVLGAYSPSTPGSAVGVYAVIAFPLAMGLGILKYRLYDIDRLISRTLSYAVVTGLVVGVYVGIVTLATKTLGFHTPVAVAASTLAAVALFNPLRLRVQRIVDRRFNRARYDAVATVAAFTAQLRDAVDLETVRTELLEVVNRAVEPAHASVWIRRRE